VEFDEESAVVILDEIKDGKLISTACSKVGLDRKVFYAWLRDKNAKVGGRPLSEAFADADEDRRMTWRESALMMVNELDEDAPNHVVTVVRAKAQMFMTMAKESSLEVFSRSVHVHKNEQGEEEKLVVIRRFMPVIDEDLGKVD
jgi:alkyl sulfatase BDS1-like metallo-beta-lactamase superfamily hydrolase